MSENVLVWEDGVAVVRPATAADLATEPPTLEDYRHAVQRHVDRVAQARLYDSGQSCASYAASTNAAWATEAAAFIAWRDAVWTQALATLAAVEADKIAPPTIAALIGALPEIIWPVA